VQTIISPNHFDDIELLNAVESRIKKHELVKADYPKNIEGLTTFFDEAKAFEELKKLSLNKKTKPLKKKDILFTEGNDATYLYFLGKGKIKDV
jgi:RIO-like serine/threonine protein kinase